MASLIKKRGADARPGVTRVRERGETFNLYSGEALEGIRRACAASSEVLARLCEACVPGVTTLELDRLAGELFRQTGGRSADFGYYGFPRQICISVNDEVVHGIGRADVIVRPGDVVSLDITGSYGGFIGDNARTVIAGGCGSPEAQRLVDTTRLSLEVGIAAARPGACVGDIGAAVQRVAEAAGFAVVRDMVGHGCGVAMHEGPQVPNYWTEGTLRLRPGMVLCVEPMVNAGTWRITIDRQDKWTVRTADGSLSAHFEHQILITENEAEILTWPRNA